MLGQEKFNLVEEPRQQQLEQEFLSDPSGYVIADIGGEQLKLVLHGGLVHELKVTDKFDVDNSWYVRQNYNLFIGERTAGKC